MLNTRALLLTTLTLLATLTPQLSLQAQTPATLAGPLVNLSNGHEYYLLEPATWTNSEMAARQLAGHLVTINSVEENAWVRDTFTQFESARRDLWIGLTNPQTWTGPADFTWWLNNFQWTSQQPSSLRLWALNETAPTNFLRSGFCKMLGSDATPPWDQGTWIEEDPNVFLNGVVEVISHLEIQSSPQNVSIPLGGAAELNVVADGPQPIYYQWQFFGTNLPGATGAILTLTNLTSSQAGPYCVVVSNSDGVLVSSPAIVSLSSLLIWGCYYHGETNVPPNVGNLIALSGGGEFSLGLRDDGIVVGWGNDLYGQTDVPWGLANVTAVAAGGLHSVALKTDGTVVCWGNNNFGAVLAPPDLTNVSAIAAGSSHTLALKTDGTVVSWGLNTGGGPPSQITNAVVVSCGGWQDLVLTSEGGLVGWPFAAGAENIAAVPRGLKNVVAISAGYDHSLALLSNGKVVAWGNNGFGQTNVPSGLSNVVAISAGGYHSLALTADGQVIAWGANIQSLPLTPPRVLNVKTIAAGIDHDLLLVGDGSPQVTVQPWDRAVFPGTSICLSAKAVGAAPLRYQWHFNGTDIANATNDSYVIENTDPTNSGLYSLSVANPIGITETRRALVTVRTGPVPAPNQPPLLPALADITMEQFTEFVVTNTATDLDGPAGSLSYSLLTAPAGMTIDSAGVIRWTPILDQVPSINLVVTVVTDSASPPLSATNSFTVTAVLWEDKPPAVIAGPFLNAATGHRYLLLDRASWTNAEDAALALGGHLVTINDADENTWVFNTFGNFGGISRDLWLGFFDPEPAVKLTNPFKRLARYRWTSGQPFTMSPFVWAEGGPFDINHPSLGFVKLLGAGNPSLWGEEQPYYPLNSVVELPLALEIIRPPQSAAIGIGCDAELRVFADGTTPLSYQWQCTGTNLPGQTQASLYFTNIQFAQSGSYSVAVSNASGTLQSVPAILSVVSVVTWGSFPFGDDTRGNVPSGLTNVAAVAAGFYHDLALNSDGTVVGWGQNYFGQTDTPAGLTNAIAIAAGAGHSLALRRDGTVVSWGGYDTSIFRVPDGLTNVIAVDAGANNSLALKADGTVVAWGASYSGPSVVAPGLSNVVAIAAGAGHDLALLADGSVADWNDGTGERNATPSDLTNAVAIAAGQLSALALRTDGTVVGWGTTIDYGGSLKVPADLTNAVGICIKWDHALAMAADGTMIAAWGTNFAGESSVPARLPNVVSIAGGYYHSIALLRDGAPSLTVQPWDRSVLPGSNSWLSAKAVSRDGMSYQWQLNGQNLTGATNDVLGIVNAQPANAGMYTLSASNSVGVAVSRHAKLTVFSGNLKAPTLEILPARNGVFRILVTGQPGRPYVFEASATPGAWSPISTNIPSVTPFEFSDRMETGPSCRFYRVRLIP
jgi:alpha-tubulin suppressor-like RCC1 family protein